MNVHVLRIAGLVVGCVLSAAQAHAQEGLFNRIFQPARPAPHEADRDAAPAVPSANSIEEMFRAFDASPVPELPPPAPEELPIGPGERVTVPLSSIGTPGEVRYDEDGDRITLVARDSSLSYVLALLAERKGLNIVAANDIDVLVSVTLHNKTVAEALTAILSVVNYTWTPHNGVIYVTSLSQSVSLPPDLQGRRVQVFPLDYASGQDLEQAVQSFLSPVGQVFVTQSADNNNRRTQEALVVEDVPYALDRIAAFIHQMDQPPRQVLIEAHILEVDLKDDRRHGVNFQHLFNLMGNNVKLLSLSGNNLAMNQIGFGQQNLPTSFFATVDGGNLTALVEMLKSTTDAKTLASPRLLVINEQRARLHSGQQIGYRQTTTTETSANEGAAFVQVGVILEITPRITRDNRILLNVRPEVSDGQINATTGVPDTQTTELETNVLLDDGFGVVIGGLIKETDSVVQKKIPFLGDVYLVGRLFQSQEIIKNRREIIVVLIPRIYPYNCDYAAYEYGNVVRTETELFEGPMLYRERPWEPKLPDAVTNPRVLRLPPVGRTFPYPASPVENAATPQPQSQYAVPRRLGPAVPILPGAPAGAAGHEVWLDGEPVRPIQFMPAGVEEAPAPNRTGRR